MNVGIPEISEPPQYVTLWLVAMYVPFFYKTELHNTLVEELHNL